MRDGPGLTPRPSAVGIELLPGSVKELFRRTFEQGATNPDDRPSGAEWHRVLTEVQADLAQCHTHPDHFYPKTSGACPWCVRGSRTARTSSPPHQVRLPPATPTPWPTPRTATYPPGPRRPLPQPPAIYPPTAAPARFGPAGPLPQPGSRSRNSTLVKVLITIAVVVAVLGMCQQIVSLVSYVTSVMHPSGVDRDRPSTQPIPDGSLVFSDDFSTLAGDWREQDGSGASVKLDRSAGQLVFTVVPDGVVSTGPNAVVSDPAKFNLRRVRLDATVTADPFPDGASFGLFCRVSPARDSYAFYVTTNGVTAMKNQAGKDTELSGVRGGLTDPHLHVECSTSDDGGSVHMRLWEGRQLILEAEDTTDAIPAGFPGGLRADLATGYGTDRFEVAVDNVAIYRL